jgi:hypothetical protein
LNVSHTYIHSLIKRLVCCSSKPMGPERTEGDDNGFHSL